MRWLRWAAPLFTGVLPVAAAMALPSPVLGQEPAAVDPFPHAKHQGLFPLCAGCHLDAAGRGGSLFPEPASCAGCHNGVELRAVLWDAPSASATHLIYDHRVHTDQVNASGGSEVACATCHAESPDAAWQVVPVRAEGCWSCHQTNDHHEQGTCASCHTPLSASTLEASSVVRWIAPKDHLDPAFVRAGHGSPDLGSDALARCATCHTQNQCVGCHVDAGLDQIQALAPAPAALASLSLEAKYPTPPSHEAAPWLEEHGRDFAPAQCSTCHTRDDCTSCHVGSGEAVGRALPSRLTAEAPGTSLTRSAPASHLSAHFELQHGASAAAAQSRCTTCHLPADCVSCHVGAAAQRLAPAQPATSVRAPRAASLLHISAPPALASNDGGGFHPELFLLSHATDSWNGLLECSNCHDTQVFCRSCHVESGLSSSGRLGPGYHDTQPLWLLRHGQSARQALESCASCHRQKDCMQCHSTTGAFRVSPHGPGFDGDDVQDKAGRTCFACHLGGPPTEEEGER